MDKGERTANGNGHPFNMLDALAELKEAGFEPEKAEAVVRMQYRIVESNLASKWDLESVRKDILRETLLIRKDMRNNFYLTVVALSAIIYTMAKFGMLSIK